MSSTHFIREILDILDFNITFPTNEATDGLGIYSKEAYKGEICHVFNGVLSYQSQACLKRREKNRKSLIKWGFKTVMTQLNKVSEYKTYLRLKKQRFKCKCCDQTFTAESTLTRFNCSISNRVKLKIATMLEDNVSMTYIAKQIGVATMTVLRVLRYFYQPRLPEKQELPKVLCFDEFKSGAFTEGAMSRILMDGEYTWLLDILEDRRKVKLEAYFQRYSLNDRNQVKIVVTDFYAPYISLTKELFPEAKVLIDRFHIVQLIGKSFQSRRIVIMKRFSPSNKRHKHLKKYWKLLQKKNRDLDWEKRYWRPSFALPLSKDHLTQTEINVVNIFDDSFSSTFSCY
ncbi:ISL3 family transposase [Enterococcus sp. LJL98]